MSEYIEKEKRSYAENFSQTMNYTQYNYGATFVSLEASIILQREISNDKIEAIVNHFDRENTTSVYFKKYWSASLYPCQTMTSYRVIFPIVPCFKSNSINTRTIWTLATLLCRVEAFWQVIES